MLYSIHAGASAVFRVPEIGLGEDEAKVLAGALVELEKHYPTQIAPEALAWFNLASVGGLIYGTRLMAFRMRMQAEAAARREAGNPLSGLSRGTADVKQEGQVHKGAASYTAKPSAEPPFVPTPSPGGGDPFTAGSTGGRPF